MHLKVVDAQVVALHSDEAVQLLRRLGLDYRISRISSIDPSPDGLGFCINWRENSLADKIPIQERQASEQVFLRRDEALARELELLRRYVFVT